MSETTTKQKLPKLVEAITGDFPQRIARRFYTQLSKNVKR